MPYYDDDNGDVIMTNAKLPGWRLVLPASTIREETDTVKVFDPSDCSAPYIWNKTDGWFYLPGTWAGGCAHMGPMVDDPLQSVLQDLTEDY